MSGHSKWAKIKRQKGVNDTKRGNLFTKLGKNITLAAKEGGGDPTMNFTLRLAVDKAKAANMPSDNIQRAIDRGGGKDASASFVRVSYEAIGPHGSTFIIDCQTDNTNRTVAEVRNIVDTGGAKMAASGSVSWQFEEMGSILLYPKKTKESEKFGKSSSYEDIDIEEATLELLDISGVEDIAEIDWEDESKTTKAIEITTKKTSFDKVVKTVDELKYVIIQAQLVKTSKEKIELNDEQIEKLDNLVANLDAHEDVDSVWVNY